MAVQEMVVGRAWGIEIRASRSWLVVFLLVTVAMGLQYDAQFAGWSDAAVVGAAIATSTLLFASVLLHEIAHCVAAQWFGIRARAVTLNFFGGMSSLSREAARPGEEIVIAAAGPAVNVALTLGLLVVRFAALPYSESVATVATFLASLNTILAVFNLLPGLPLDGGRIFRAVAWWATGSFEKGTKIAAAGGVALSGLLLMVGLALLLSGYVDGLWVGFIGIYLYGRARMSRFELDIRMALDGLTVGSMWLRTLPQVERSLTLDQFARELAPTLDGSEDPHFMVVDEGVIWGIVAASYLNRVDAGLWSVTKVGEVMAPIAKVEKLSMQTEIMSAIELMNASEVGELPVIENNAVQGFVGREALLRFVSSRVASAVPQNG
jgi:Zn-dependent protease